MSDIDEARAKAAAHQEHLDRNTKFYSVQDLAARWSVSANTVRTIPHTTLPYISIGLGLTRERRRYRPDDVMAYELTRLERAS